MVISLSDSPPTDSPAQFYEAPSVFPPKERTTVTFSRKLTGGDRNSPLINTYLLTIINPSPKLLLWCLVPSSIVCKAASILSDGKPSLENGKNQSTDEERIKMKGLDFFRVRFGGLFV